MLQVTDNVFCAHLEKLDLGCVQNGIHHKVKSIYLFIWLKTTETYSVIVLVAGHVKPSASGAAYFLSLGGGIYSGPSPSLGW